MTALRARTLVRSPRRRLLAFVVILALGGMLFYHHAEPSDMDGMVAGALCLAILGGGTALLLSEALPRWLPKLRAISIPRPRAASRPSSVRTVPARAGPLFLRLSVIRR